MDPYYLPVEFRCLSVIFNIQKKRFPHPPDKHCSSSLSSLCKTHLTFSQHTPPKRSCPHCFRKNSMLFEACTILTLLQLHLLIGILTQQISLELIRHNISKLTRYVRAISMSLILHCFLDKCSQTLQRED